MHTKRFDTFFKSWVQFRVGAIPHLPNQLITRNFSFIYFLKIIFILRLSSNFWLTIGKHYFSSSNALILVSFYNH